MIVKCFIVVAALQVVRGDWNCQNLRYHPNWRLLDTGSYCGRSYYNVRSTYKETMLQDQPLGNRFMKPILGGQNAYRGEFPWMAALMKIGPGNRPHFSCGGSIISEYYILTASHCLIDEYRRNMVDFVRLGEINLQRSKYCSEYGGCSAQAMDVGIQERIYHLQYSPRTFQCDIGLIRLKTRIRFSPYMRPICLPTPCSVYGRNFDLSQLTAAGWGLVSKIPERWVHELKKVDVPVTPVNRCQTYYGIRIQGMICAGVPYRKGTFQGDSGGPLMYKAAADGPTRAFIVGLVSFGGILTPARPYKLQPDVYTRVDQYLPFILNNVHA